MLLPIFNGLIKTTHFDPEMSALADRHYSRRTIGARQFCYSGRKLVLRNTEGTVLFVWMYPNESMRMDGQTGYNNAIFRNESNRMSSEIILEAEEKAFEKWGPNRLYTYIDPRKIKSPNPGYCYKIAGWEYAGLSKSGKHLLVKYGSLPPTPQPPAPPQPMTPAQGVKPRANSTTLNPTILGALAPVPQMQRGTNTRHINSLITVS